MPHGRTTYTVTFDFPELWEAVNALARQRVLFEMRGLRPDTDDVMRHTCEAEIKLRAVLFPVTPEPIARGDTELERLADWAR